jgi:SepF-like predicted cell division protein (DUF552 family)
MSRLDELKKQYPELNVSMFDIMTRMDQSKSYKYIPLMCKIFGKRFSVKEMYSKNEIPTVSLDLQSNMISKGVSTDGLIDNQMYFIQILLDHFNNETYNTLTDFMEHMENGRIERNDVTSYKDIDDLRSAITLASMREWSKDLEGQVIKEFEDDKWIIVRPLTFSSSIKYGASTKWCTTYKKEKQYFEKYWRQGVLVYFINKTTGYKFAGFKDLGHNNELSFWNPEDLRIDYLEIDVDDYLFPIVKKIFKSELSNKNLCSDEIQKQVHEECLPIHERVYITDETIQENNQLFAIGDLDEADYPEPAERFVREINHNLVVSMRPEPTNGIA